MVEQLKYIPWRVLPTSHQNCFGNCFSYISNPMVMLPFSHQQKGWKVSQETCQSNPTYWDLGLEVASFPILKDMAKGKIWVDRWNKHPPWSQRMAGIQKLTFHFKEAFFRVQHDGFPAMFHVGRETKDCVHSCTFGKSESSKCFFWFWVNSVNKTMTCGLNCLCDINEHR